MGGFFESYCSSTKSSIPHVQMSETTHQETPSPVLSPRAAEQFQKRTFRRRNKFFDETARIRGRYGSSDGFSIIEFMAIELIPENSVFADELSDMVELMSSVS